MQSGRAAWGVLDCRRLLVGPAAVAGWAAHACTPPLPPLPLLPSLPPPPAPRAGAAPLHLTPHWVHPKSTYEDFFGGIVIVTADQFRRINGFGTQVRRGTAASAQDGPCVGWRRRGVEGALLGAACMRQLRLPDACC